MGAEIEIKGADEVEKRMQALSDDLSGSPMEQGMRQAALLVTADAKRNAPVNTGRLRASITPEVRVEGKEVVGVVGSNVEYAPFMELGTRPHFPPLGPILDWTHLVLRPAPKEEWAVAKGVQRAIGRRGLEAREYLKKAFDDNKARIDEILKTTVSGIVKSAGGK